MLRLRVYPFFCVYETRTTVISRRRDARPLLEGAGGCGFGRRAQPGRDRGAMRARLRGGALARERGEERAPALGVEREEPREDEDEHGEHEEHAARAAAAVRDAAAGEVLPQPQARSNLRSEALVSGVRGGDAARACVGRARERAHLAAAAAAARREEVRQRHVHHERLVVVGVLRNERVVGLVGRLLGLRARHRHLPRGARALARSTSAHLAPRPRCLGARLGAGRAQNRRRGGRRRRARRGRSSPELAGLGCARKARPSGRPRLGWRASGAHLGGGGRRARCDGRGDEVDLRGVGGAQASRGAPRGRSRGAGAAVRARCGSRAAKKR